MYIGDAGYTDTYRIGTFIVKMPILEILSLYGRFFLIFTVHIGLHEA